MARFFYENESIIIVYKKTLLLVGILTVVFTGCAQKTSVKAIKASKVSDKAIKNIGVLPFKNDDISQSAQIDSAISQVTIDGKKYFNLVDRENIKKIMEEKKLNESGIVNLVSDDYDLGIAQIETFVSGSVIASSESTSNYKESRTDYDTCTQYKTDKNGKKRCTKYRKYYVQCQSKNFSVQTKVKLVKVGDGSTVFANTYGESAKYSHCSDDSGVLPSKKEVNTKLAGRIAQDLIKDIAPSYIYFSVTLLEDPDIDYSDREEKIFENSLMLIENKRIEKANELLKTLNTSLQNRSYVALYNLAVTEEALGNMDEAYNLYRKAEDLSLMNEPNEEIMKAVKRAQKSLKEQKKAKKQLGY